MQRMLTKAVREVMQQVLGFWADFDQPLKVRMQKVKPGVSQALVCSSKEAPQSALCEQKARGMKNALGPKVRKWRSKTESLADVSFRGQRRSPGMPVVPA